MTVVDNYIKIKLKLTLKFLKNTQCKMFRVLVVFPLPGKNLEADSYSTGD